MIDITQYTAHLSPGKFEGEPAASEYFYDRMLDGVGETLYSEDSEGALFKILDEEAKVFDLYVDGWFLLLETDNGFVYGMNYQTREDAINAFLTW